MWGLDLFRFLSRLDERFDPWAFPSLTYEHISLTSEGMPRWRARERKFSLFTLLHTIGHSGLHSKYKFIMTIITSEIAALFPALITRETCRWLSINTISQFNYSSENSSSLACFVICNECNPNQMNLALYITNMWPWSTKAVLSSTDIFVAIVNNT